MNPVEVSTPATVCFRCDYDLRGIADDQPCPECGLLAIRSRQASDELYLSRPRWLRSISRGTNLIVLSIVLAAGWGIFGSDVIKRIITLLPNQSLQTNFSVWFGVYKISWWSGVFLSELLLLLGAVFLTRAEGYSPADLRDKARRRWIRLLAIASPAGIFLLSKYGGFGTLPPAIDDWMDQLTDGLRWNGFAIGFLSVSLSLLTLLIFFQLRSLARRTHSAHLAEHCAIVGISSACSILYAGCVVGMFDQVDEFNGHYWLFRSTLTVPILTSLGVLAILLWLWSLYLLIRFAISFHAASRRMRNVWIRDDRAAPLNQ